MSTTTEATMTTETREKIMRLARRLWPFAAAAAGLALIVWFFAGRGEGEEPYRFAAVDRGAIARTVSATGTLKPLVSVNVGSTVSGLVETVEADFNSVVRAGQVLARLEPETFEQRVTQAQANLAQAQAQLAVAEADYARYGRLETAGFASDQLMQQQRAARDSARAVVEQTEAALASARIDLARSVVRSPIDGVVVDRQINPGQSVAASFQAPTLFVIAQDLARLQAEITVDEADIGEVREGQPVRFTVDAFPSREFEARVSQVRQQGTEESGVVSYTVVVEADNPGRRLLPGMTANAEIVIEEQADVLRLPNAALRFRPADPAIAARGQAAAAEPAGAAQTQAPRAQGAGDGRGVGQFAEALELTAEQQEAARGAFQQAMASAGARPGPEALQSERRAFMRRVREAALRQIEPTLSARQKELLAQLRAAGAEEGRSVTRQAVAWVLRGGKPEPVQIEVGVADNSNTALVGGRLEAGDQVIIGGGPQAKDRAQGGPLGGGPPPRLRGA